MRNPVNGQSLCCPECGGTTHIKDSRGSEKGYIWRRRQCKNNPEHVFTTYELPVEEYDSLIMKGKQFSALQESLKPFTTAKGE